jgi:hypothetical protein
MSQFLRTKCHLNGLLHEPKDICINVNQIVSFHAGSIRFDGVNESPVVYLDTTRTSGLIIPMSIDELTEAMELVFANQA